MGLYTTLVSDLVMTGEGRAQELQTAYVTLGFFRSLGIAAAIGTSLLAEREDSEELQVVISHSLWLSQFGGDRSVVGRKLTLNNAAHEVVGVMPANFQFPEANIQVWCYLGIIPQTSTHPLEAPPSALPGGTGAFAGRDHFGPSRRRARDHCSPVSQRAGRNRFEYHGSHPATIWSLWTK